jgi:uncharacterized membrane-anchored protein YhcB (DUF1043 family)
MRELWDFVTTHAVALTLVITLASAVIVGALYIGSLGTRVAQAEDAIKTMGKQVDKIDTTDEERVKRIYDKLDIVTNKLDLFTRDMQQHYLADAETSKILAVNLQKMASDVEIIRSRMEHSSSPRNK